MKLRRGEWITVVAVIVGSFVIGSRTQLQPVVVGVSQAVAIAVVMPIMIGALLRGEGQRGRENVLFASATGFVVLLAGSLGLGIAALLGAYEPDGFVLQMLFFGGILTWLFALSLVPWVRRRLERRRRDGEPVRGQPPQPPIQDR